MQDLENHFPDVLDPLEESEDFFMSSSNTVLDFDRRLLTGAQEQHEMPYSDKIAFSDSVRTLPGCADNMNDSFDAEGPMKNEREEAEEAMAAPSSHHQKVVPLRQPLANFDLTMTGASSPQSPHSDKMPLSFDVKSGGGVFSSSAATASTSSSSSSSSSSMALDNSYPPQSISARLADSSSKNVARIGSDWSVAISCFKQSSSLFECIGHLRHISELLNTVDRHDRIKYCKADFTSAVSHLRERVGSRKGFAITDELHHEIVGLIKYYFNEYTLRRMPLCLMWEIFGCLGLDEFSVYCATCKDWNALASRDEVWKRLYHHRFTRSNPTSAPLAKTGFKIQYKARMADPELGDKVEVAWRGKFRLEARDVYQGLAWWVAEVVDKHTKLGKYKIRYPGWESRWDEWVPRARLRWAVESNTLCTIKQGDVVELWCCGANVPGAWLESRVKKVRDGRYCVNRVLTTGTTSHSRPLWADRDRLRLVRHPQDESNKREVSSGSEEYDRAIDQPRSISRFGQIVSFVGNTIGFNQPGNIAGVGADAIASNGGAGSQPPTPTNTHNGAGHLDDEEEE